MIGILYVLRDDAEELVASYQSLLKTIPPNDYFKVCVVNGGNNTPEDIKLVQHYVGTEVIGDYPHLSEALNAGIYSLLGYDESNIKNIALEEAMPACKHIIWLHPDQAFYQYDWMNKLAKVYDYLYPLVARLAPSTSCIDDGINLLQAGELLVHSNNCPFMISADYVKLAIQKRGWVYDPDFKNIGGIEDHCAWFDILEMGMFVCVTPLVDVCHIGAGTRFLRDTNIDQMYNREVMFKKYGRDIFPVVDFSLKEVSKELGTNFGYLKEEIINIIPNRDKAYAELKEIFNKKRAKLGLPPLTR